MAPLPTQAQRTSTGTLVDYYEILGCARDASYDQLKVAFHRKVGAVHPDKAASADSVADASGLGNLTFSQLHDAWRCLSDDTRRIVYDIKRFGRSALCPDAANDSVGKTLAMKLQLQAWIDMQNMEVELEKKIQKERAAKGVLVLSALYGHLLLKEELLSVGLSREREIVAEDLVGPVIDVKLPVQVLVDKHKLVLPGGASASKADLPGFFNPAPLDEQLEMSLYVQYEFRGRLHETLVGDRETLKMPQRKHAVPADQAPRGPFSGENTEMLLRLARQHASPPPAPPPAAQESHAGTGALAAAPLTAPPVKWLRPEQALAAAAAEYRRQQILVDGREVSQQDMFALLLGAGAAFVLTMLLELRNSRLLIR